MPRDVEAAVGEIEQVFLYNVDDLQAVVQENLSRRSSEIGRAEAIVSRGGRALLGVAALARARCRPSWRCGSGSSRSAAPNSSGSRASSVRLTPEARASVDEVTRLIVEKLLLAPTAQLKALPDEETQIAYTEAVNRLFELRDDTPVSPAGEEMDTERPNRTRS